MGNICCLITLVLLFVTSVAYSMQKEGCKSPQYLEVEKQQVIQCFFGHMFVGVHWFNSSETLHNEPILSYSDSEKSGEGYISKEFDIYQNGSLIISSVRTTHEGLFTAIVFYPKTDDPVYYNVRIETIVKPLDPFPEVTNCSVELAICLKQYHEISNLSCVVRNSRPAVTLGWKAVSAYQERNVSSHPSVIKNNSVYTSLATVSQHSLSNSFLLSLYVCETNSIPGIYDKHESYVLVRNDAYFNVAAIEPITIYVGQYSPVKLNCSTKNILWLVWEKRHGTSDEFHPLLFAVLLGPVFVENYDNGYEIHEKGALVVNDASAKTDGTYRCIGSDGIKDTIVIYDVVGHEVSTAEIVSTQTAKDQSRKAIAGLAVFVVVLLLVVVLFFLLRRKVLTVLQRCRGDQTEHNHPEERMDNLLQEEENFDELIAQMKTGLRGKYQSQYSNILPFLKTLEAAYSIRTIFVKCPIALLRPPKDRHHTDTWQRLESYNDIFRSDGFTSTRCILKAYPGYGKTTLALKLAYDWTEGEGESFAKDEDLFIFLRMSQLDTFSNIYQAIRSTLLPKDSPLNVNDIEKVLNTCNSLTIFFDDFEEYSDELKFRSSDLLSIIKGDMFQTHKVIVTTRSFKFMKDYNITGDKVRLTGFDHSARKTYVGQVFQNEDPDNSEVLKQLEKNPALCDLSEIPLFFAAFAHMPSEYEHLQTLDSITKVVSYLMECFEKHAKGRFPETKLIAGRTMDSNEYRKLDKIAFKSLARESNKEWSQSDLCGRIGENLYKKCIKTGILIQEERFVISDNPDNRKQGNYRYKTMVRFHHKIFCEWHAAYYVVKKIKRSRFWPTSVVRKTLKKLHPSSCELMYIFACGLYPEGTPQITSFLKEQPETYTLIMRCIYERNNDVGDIRESLEKMCKDPVIFYNEESSLKQNTALKFLDICCRSKMNIKAVWCYNCIEQDKCTDQYLALESGATIPILDTLNELMLYSDGLKITRKSAESILKYAEKCSSVVTLIIFGNFMPLTFTEDEPFHKLIERNVIVTWIPISDRRYTLDLVLNKWKDTKGEIVEEHRHQELEKKFCEFWNLETEND